MPRWNKSLVENCKDVMLESIKNIKPALAEKLLRETINIDLANNKKEIEAFLRDRLKIAPSLSKHTKGYWLARGWSYDESYVKSKENKQPNNKSVYSQQTWLEKINPLTTTYYTLEEAEIERNSRRSIKKEYWIKKGYSEEESIQLANDTKNKNNKKGSTAAALSPSRRVSSKRCIEYFLARGATEDEAKQLVSDSQKFFSKKICIEKYGEIEGIKIWSNRQVRWQEKLNGKTDEEKARINRAKLSKGISVSTAEKIIVEQLSLKGILVVTQFTLFRENKKQFVYDIMYNNKIIEYNGDFWHSNPLHYLETFLNPRTKIIAKDKWLVDKQKIEFAQKQGYEVLVVWKSNFKQNKEEIIKQCIQFLTQ